jgi:hypothetical protein
VFGPRFFEDLTISAVIFPIDVIAHAFVRTLLVIRPGKIENQYMV